MVGCIVDGVDFEFEFCWVDEVEVNWLVCVGDLVLVFGG